MLDGVEIYELDHGIQFQGVQTKPRSIRVKGKLGFGSSPDAGALQVSSRRTPR